MHVEQLWCDVYSAWLKDAEDEIIRGISKKAAVVANLTIDTAEDLQVSA